MAYKHLCLLDPDDSQRPKPSSNAIPMPEGMNKKAVSINNRQDGVPTQDQPFHENPDFKWHDFYNLDMPPPGYLIGKFQPAMKLKVDIEKPDQLYYYLGEHSTDAKCFFTDKPGSNEIVAKANFIERVQPRPVYQYQGPRQVLPAAHPAPKQATNAAGFANIRPAKPYIYKPKDPSQTNSYMWHVDRESLANQRNFLTESAPDRQGSQGYQPPPYNYQGSGMQQQAAPLRPFPIDQYYSTKTLPAAYPGEHSKFTKAARRESEGAQTMQRPSSSYTPNYQSIRQQQTQMKQSQGGAPTVPMMAQSTGEAATPNSAPCFWHNPYVPHESRPSSSAYSHHSPYGAPLTPATTHSQASALREGPPTDEEYLANLRRYPYLWKSYLRKPKVYESPYPPGGGFSSEYQPSKPPKSDLESKPSSAHTPQGSVGSLVDAESRASQPWTPPSQVWDRVGLSNGQPPQSHQPLPGPPSQTRYPQPVYSTPQEFQRQIQSMPSTASRDGAHARMLRDQGYMPYQPQPPHWCQRNSFGQPYDTASMYNSPKAPTPSPLSDPNTPGQTPGAARQQHQAWGTLPRAEVAPMRRPSAGGYGPSVPPMQGENEMWGRYT